MSALGLYDGRHNPYFEDVLSTLIFQLNTDPLSQLNYFSAAVWSSLDGLESIEIMQLKDFNTFYLIEFIFPATLII